MPTSERTNISIKDFAITGFFGPVALGMHKDDVIEKIGTPDNDIQYFAGSGSLNYGGFEIFYDTFTGAVVGIQNDHLLVKESARKADIYFKTENTEVDIWFLKFNRNIGFNQVTTLLANEGIAFSITKHFDDDLIRFDSGVTLDFINDPKTGENVLNGIRLFEI